jgi:hypothetical protein
VPHSIFDYATPAFNARFNNHPQTCTNDEMEFSRQSFQKLLSEILLAAAKREKAGNAFF